MLASNLTKSNNLHISGIKSDFLPDYTDFVTTPKFEKILTNLFNVLLIEIKKQNDNNQHIENKLNKLINQSQYLILSKTFTLEEVVEYLNKVYGSNIKKQCTEDSILEFMKEIKMIKSDTLLPYSKFERDHHVNFNVNIAKDNQCSLIITKMGIEYLIKKLKEYHYII